MLKDMFADLNGVPWLSDGRDPKKGLDCYGLVMEASKRMGFYAPDCNDPTFNKYIWETSEELCKGFADKYGFNKKEGEMIDEVLFVPIHRPEPGCVVMFRILYPYSDHIGVVLDDCDQFIHAASRNKATCIERLSSIQWKHRISGFYKWTKKLQL